MKFINDYLRQAGEIVCRLDRKQIKKIVGFVLSVKKGKGRVFFLGVGGGAGHASHAVNDFRKICGIESYAATDNVSELTARINDDGWETSYVNWLKGSNLNDKDMLFIFSVGGGDSDRNISLNIINSLKYAKQVGVKICGVVGRDGGYTARVADACVVVPPVNNELITAHTEGFQAVVWHLLVSHPELQEFEMKWESIQ